jgi:hypothetical protein
MTTTPSSSPVFRCSIPPQSAEAEALSNNLNMFALLIDAVTYLLLSLMLVLAVADKGVQFQIYIIQQLNLYPKYKGSLSMAQQRQSCMSLIFFRKQLTSSAG